MPERVVVSFNVGRGSTGGIPLRREEAGDPSGAGYLERAVALKKQAEALGARLCAWSAQTFSFDFEPDEIEEAISLAQMAEGDHGGAPEQRFGVGIAQGMLDGLDDGSSRMMLSWGRPLLMAVVLARVARAGEILVDPDLPALRAGELLVVGSRLCMDRGVRVRGATLDTAEPLRKQAALQMSRVQEPALVGVDDVLERLAVPLGCIGVIRADPGAGGSRLLAELTARLAPSRSLFIAPVGASQEPLGAIRRALSRSAAWSSPPALPEHLRYALDRLLTGEGVDLWSTAELLDNWLSPADGRFGVLAVDDVEQIDIASLEAIANAINVRGAFRMLARIDVSALLPPTLGSIPRGPSAVVNALGPEDGARLAAAFMDGALSSQAVARWTRRGGGVPLGIREALLEGLCSGDLAWRGVGAVPRRRASGRGEPASPQAWIERRMRFMVGPERTVLTALAMLGGDASSAMIDSLAIMKGGRGARTAQLEEALIAAGWVTRPEPGWLKLLSRTATEAILARLEPTDRVQWHLATAATIEQHGSTLARADAAWHAARAGDGHRAARLALQAAHAAADASLDAATEGLRTFARVEDPTLVTNDPQRPVTDSVAPPTARTPIPDIGMPTLAPPPPSSEHGRLSPESGGPLSRRTGLADGPDSNMMTAESPAFGSSRLAELAKEALVQGDITTLEALLVQLKATGEHKDLVERMGGFVALGRGAKLEALGKLRAAAQWEHQPPAQRARALLAYGVALAAAGRSDSALLETLDALARAREAADRHGEHVCARFLIRLAAAAGHPTAAATWAWVARNSMPGK